MREIERESARVCEREARKREIEGNRQREPERHREERVRSEGKSERVREEEREGELYLSHNRAVSLSLACPSLSVSL